VNFTLYPEVFPLRRLADPGNNQSTVLQDTSIRVGSAGVFRRSLERVVPGHAAETGRDVADHPEFEIGGVQVRHVTVRNAPSVINAVFHVRNFWDGRASRVFNGFDPSGDESAVPGILTAREGRLERRQVRMDRASLASQAVGPILDATEMSYEGRTWPKLGRKMLRLAPLAYQQVSPADSVLGPMARIGGRGLEDRYTYPALLRAAFRPELWDSVQLVDEAGNTLESRTGEPSSDAEFTQAEYNFSLFWGLAILAYEATLISDDAPFDRFMEGVTSTLTSEQQEGMNLFQNAGRCNVCHGGPAFTAASFTAGGNNGNNNRAFQRTGVRPIAEDAGAGNGAFKSSGLRNIEFTGPYFHNGGQATLEQVIDFYVRDGDFANGNAIRAFNAGPAQRASLAAFLRALTDDRVRYERAPFDHPELCVPAGHEESAPGVLIAFAPGAQFSRSALEKWRAIPATGAGGSTVPLQTFEELLAGIGADGSRAHTMTDACTAPMP
jgi:cytochrome c peroxidase